MFYHSVWQPDDMKRKRHDWFHPALITLILEALRKRSGNYRHAVNDLKLQYPKLFVMLNESTVRTWFPPGCRSHTVEDMKEWVTKVVAPNYKATCERMQLTAGEQVAVLKIDVYACHISAEFRDWLKAKYPYFKLRYVPAGCTPVAQELDIFCNRIFKHIIKELFRLYQIEMLRKQLTAGISSTDVKLDVSLSTLKPLSMAWLLRAFARLKDCKPGILSAFVKSGTAKAWDVDFQRRAAGDVNRLFSMLPGPADAASDEVAPVLTEEQQRSASEQQFAGAITDEEAATVAQITEDAASPVDPAARIVRGVTVVEPDTAFEATPSESLADAVSAKAAELASAGQIDEDALAAATQGKPRGRKRKPRAEQPAAGASDAAPAHAAPQGKKKRGRPPGSKNKKTLEKERAAAAAAAGAVAVGPPTSAEGA